MNIYISERQFDPAVIEMTDRADNRPDMFRQNLKNLRIINRYFGGLGSVKKYLLRLIKQMDPQKKIEILDLATGSADHPLAIVALAKKIGCDVAITAVDNNPQVLDIARERTASIKNIKIQQKDILNLDYASQSFDIVLCSLTLHHFSWEQAAHILKEMQRLSRVGFIVNDLGRSRLAALTVWLYIHFTTRNPMTHHDAYISILRAFTSEEFAALARQAGIKKFAIDKHLFFRLILTGEMHE